MKLRNEIYFIIAGYMFLFLTGCNEKNYSIKTKINPDGSFERIFIVEKGDSSSVYNHPFPLVFNSSWEVSIKKTGDTNKVFIYSAKKYFNSAEDFQKELVNSNVLGKLKITTHIDKQFRWFYTYYNYNEIYKGNIPFHSIPLEKYFTEKEIRQIYSDSTDKLLKTKIDDWWQRNIFEEYFNVLMNGVNKINDPTFTVGILKSKKEELYKALINSNSNSEEELRICENVLGTKAVWKLKDEFVKQEKSITKKIESSMENGTNGNYINEIILPGIILSTNAKTIEGNKASWKFGKSDFLYVEMQAQSRLINAWAFIITGLIILIILVGLGIPLIRRKKAFIP